ncbi:MAG: choice-of-anchor B family protein [Calditrichaeota bacterium]|nr:MAG: choice-of-anchor B family protein [Calditrichota bacterium]
MYPKTTFSILVTFLAVLTLSCSDDDNGGGRSGIELLAKLDLRGPTTDVWGYVDANTGKEYALVGFGNFNDPPNSGFHIVDVSDAKNPVLVATVNSVPGFDVKTWDHYAYGVNGRDDGLGGVVDLTDPAAPAVVGSFPSGHNMFIADNGYMYLETGNVQLRIFNLNPDPTAPVQVWRGGNSDGHDATVIGNTLYDFGGFGATNIYDVSDPTDPKLKGSIDAPFVSFHHSGWPTEDGNFLFICNELSQHPDPDITVWDIRDPAKPQLVGEFKDADANVHNLFVIGNFAYTSYYAAGFRVFDVSDPAQIKLVDEFDTSPGVDQGTTFQGAFGVYPLAPSGHIYVSDVTDGLLVFSFTPPAGGTSAGIVAP